VLVQILRQLDLQPNAADISAGDHFSSEALRRIEKALRIRGNREQPDSRPFEPDEDFEPVRGLPDIPDMMDETDELSEPVADVRYRDAPDADEIDRKLQLLVGAEDEESSEDDSESTLVTASKPRNRGVESRGYPVVCIRDLLRELEEQLLARGDISYCERTPDGFVVTMEMEWCNIPVLIEVRATAETRTLVVSASFELPTQTIEDSALRVLQLYAEPRCLGTVFSAPIDTEGFTSVLGIRKMVQVGSYTPVEIGDIVDSVAGECTSIIRCVTS
jgi:hypothetical protein